MGIEGVFRPFSYIYSVNQSLFFLTKTKLQLTHSFGQRSQYPFQVVVLRILSSFEIQIQYFHVDINNPFPRAPLIRKLLKYQTLSVKLCQNSQSNWQIRRNYFAPRDGKMKRARVFQIALNRVVEKSPIPVRGEVRQRILVKVGIFSSGGENLLRSDLDHSKLFQC